MAWFLAMAKKALLQAKSVTATTSQQTVSPDNGYDGLLSVTVNPQNHTETYTPTSRAAALDMGANNNNRYVNTNSVPNSNSGTYTFASGDTGGTKDMGETNSYRYVNATNVYNKGKADGSFTTLTELSASGTTTNSATVNVGDYMVWVAAGGDITSYTGVSVISRSNGTPSGAGTVYIALLKATSTSISVTSSSPYGVIFKLS